MILLRDCMSVYPKRCRVPLTVLSSLLRGEPENFQNLRIMKRDIYSLWKERKDNYSYLFMLLDIRQKLCVTQS
jgi:hypothetical protein